MRFADFYGNNNAKEQLSGAFDNGRVPHALLIDGSEGSGKRTLARIIAQAAVCEGGGELPCGHCRQCINAMGGNHPDITTYSGTGGARSFSVDTVRHVRLDAYVTPNDAAKKVYILMDVHNMTEQAQNALLKILEEPPSYVMFILTCCGRSRVLETVQSRCAIVTLGPVTEGETILALMSENPALDRLSALKAARLSGGIIGRAKKGLEEGSFSDAAALSTRFAAALCGYDQYKFLRLSGSLEKDQGLLLAFIELMPLLFRDALAMKAGGQAKLSGCAQEAASLAAGLTRHQVYSLTQRSLEVGVAMERYANKTLMLTNLFSQLWQCAHEISAFG